jgi:hypothetical protein
MRADFESLTAASGAGLYQDNWAMAVLQAYFDESGKLKDKGEHVVFGGIAGRLDEVSVFSRRWKEVLGSDVDHIHMRDAMRLEGEFEGYDETRRDEILIECAKVAQSSSAMIVVSEMDKNDFLGLAQEEQQRLNNPTYGGFEACVRSLARQFYNHDLYLWYDESQEYAETCLKLYQRMKNLNTDLLRRLPSLTFADDQQFPGLQAADMIAYCAYVVQRDRSNAKKVIREILSIFKKEFNGQEHLLYLRGGQLGSGILES